MMTEIQQIIENPSFYSDTDILDIIKECSSDELNELYNYASNDVIRLVDDATYRRI
jgi:hypothetical protein